MPAGARMAHQAGVAPLTMWRALRTLAAEGVVEIRGPKRGIFAGGTRHEAPSTDQTSAPSPRWLSVRQRILDDIVHGTFSPGSLLPSCKELSHRYGTCWRVLHRALQSLVADNHLTPFRRRYRVGSPRRSSYQSSIAVIVAPTMVSHLHHMTPLAAEFWRVLESQCARRDVRFVICDADSAQGTVAGGVAGYGSLRAFMRSGSVLGSIVLTLGFSKAKLEPLLRYLQRLGSPVAIVDDAGADLLPDWTFDDRRFALLRISATVKCGRDMGNHLIALGHRRIAAVNVFSSGHWVAKRIRGLRAAFDDAGIEEGVIPFESPNPIGVQSYWKGRLHDEPFGSLITHLESFETDLYHSSGDILRRSLRKRIEPWLRSCYHSLLGLPLFEQAFADRSVTAWVGINDDLGLAALDFLAQQRVSVPQHISVVGFDDTYDALTRGLTSYNFGIPRLIHTSLEFVVDRGKRPCDSGFYEVPGDVVVRGSSGGTTRRHGDTETRRTKKKTRRRNAEARPYLP